MEHFIQKSKRTPSRSLLVLSPLLEAHNIRTGKQTSPESGLVKRTPDHSTLFKKQQPSINHKRLQTLTEQRSPDDQIEL